LEDAWQCATVYAAFSTRWLDVNEELPDEGMPVTFGYGDLEDPSTYKFGAGKFVNGQFYDDLQSQSGAGIRNVFVWKELVVPVLRLASEVQG
jgi:hypothetical protein